MEEKSLYLYSITMVDPRQFEKVGDFVEYCGHPGVFHAFPPTGFPLTKGKGAMGLQLFYRFHGGGRKAPFRLCCEKEIPYTEQGHDLFEPFHNLRRRNKPFGA